MQLPETGPNRSDCARSGQIKKSSPYYWLAKFTMAALPETMVAIIFMISKKSILHIILAFYTVAISFFVGTLYFADSLSKNKS
jgi:hypothetical protein